MRLHPLSVPYRAVVGSLNLGTLLFVATVLGSGVDPRSVLFLGTLVAYLLASVLYQFAYYRRFEYDLSAGSFDITSGVFNRRDREIPLRRIQNVDVSQNPIQRALGIATLQIETAGGGETEASLKYVSTGEARRLRTELRRLARQEWTGPAGGGEVEPDTDESVPTGSVAGAAYEDRGELAFALSNRNLLLLSLFTIDAGAGVVSSILGAVVSSMDPQDLPGASAFVEYLPGGRVEAVLLLVAAVAVFAWVLSVALTFARYYGFELRRTRDGLEYERGLLQRFSGTIPVEKVQTVSVRENVLKRRFGYATVAVETAGYSPGQSTRGRQLAVPLAGRDRALAIARSIEPFEGAEFQRPPRRARLRYVVRYAAATALVAALAYGVARWSGVLRTVDPSYALALLVPLALTPVAAHYTWVHRGYRTGDGHFVARSGFWRRVTRVVPYYRVQTVVDARTVFQRRRRLASVTADTASSATLLGGGATAIDVDDGDADRLRGLLRDRLQRSLQSERGRRRRRRGTLDSTATGDVDAGDPGAVEPDADGDRPDGTNGGGAAGDGPEGGGTERDGTNGGGTAGDGPDQSGRPGPDDATGERRDPEGTDADSTGDTDD